ncbi:MAG: hypothetical protein JXA60_01530 [Candidatus Coatesbacteria bacterium]|nr:hypothetical protein [Candidatus Coatesbacteria bacterium]
MSDQIDLSKINTFSINEMERKVDISSFPELRESGTFTDFWNSLPDILAAKSLKTVCRRIATAYNTQKKVLFLFGGHVIKTGCGLIIADLIKKGIINAVAVNGSVIIHDVELAYFARTSEDVQEGLEKGTFGMAKETAEMINGAVKRNCESGYGESIKKLFRENPPSYSGVSLLSAVAEMDIPLTVHIAIGTDIIHQHPCFNGASVGEASTVDFKKLAKIISLLSHGVIVNIGSAVILPEVFLKALTVARNLGYKVEDFTAVNFDMIQHYRPNTNIVNRPTFSSGEGYSITGHHEIMLPLLRMGILNEVKAGNKDGGYNG